MPSFKAKNSAGTDLLVHGGLWYCDPSITCKNEINSVFEIHEEVQWTTLRYSHDIAIGMFLALALASLKLGMSLALAAALKLGMFN